MQDAPLERLEGAEVQENSRGRDEGHEISKAISIAVGLEHCATYFLATLLFRSWFRFRLSFVFFWPGG